MSDWEQIAKYLAGECTPTEKAEFEAWLAEHAENRAYFEAQSQLWEEAAKEGVVPEIDVEAGLNKVHQAMHVDDEVKPRKSLSWLKYAAVFAILLTSTLIWYLPGRHGKSTIINYTDEALIVDLPDGSKVWLNEGAELTYSNDMSVGERDVVLVGEAYFDVARKTKNPFRVKAGTATVQVLGTEFNVSTQKEGAVKVAVLEGSVALFATENEQNQLTLKAFERGALESASGQLQKSELEDENDIAWKTGVLKFDQANLKTVSAYLEAYYKTTIELSTQLEDCTISTVFDNISLNDAIEVLELTLGIKVTKDSGNLIMSGSCS